MQRALWSDTCLSLRSRRAYLPSMNDVDGCGAAGESGHASSDAGSKRILVVDDEPAVLVVLTKVLKRAGYVVVGCADGVAAIREMERNSYDAIVSDMSLPGMNGVEVVKELRRRDPNVPVLFTTGHCAPDTSSSALACGAVEVLEKPIDLATLRESVSRLAALRKGAPARRGSVTAEGIAIAWRMAPPPSGVDRAPLSDPASSESTPPSAVADVLVSGDDAHPRTTDAPTNATNNAERASRAWDITDSRR